MSEEAYWVAFNRVPGIGPVRFRSLLTFFGNDLQAAWEADRVLLARAGLGQRTIENLVKTRRSLSLEREMARIERYGVTLLTWISDDYPRLLRDIPNAPPVLYLRGKLLPEDEWAVAIVGTRKMTGYGRRSAETLASDLASTNVTIVSGLALGVDRVAHEAAMKRGGRTIAVLASGVERAYPASNRKLAEAIVANGQGALVSDYPIGTQPEAGNFPPRNRIISGLSLATIVVEAGERSGALITAENALEQGREVFAVPGSIFSPASRGTNDLISQGATPALSARQILRSLNLQMAEPQKVVRQMAPLTPLEERLLAQLSDEPLHIDEVGRRCDLEAAELGSSLALLELKGFVRQVGAMQYIKN